MAESVGFRGRSLFIFEPADRINIIRRLTRKQAEWRAMAVAAGASWVSGGGVRTNQNSVLRLFGCVLP